MPYKYRLTNILNTLHIKEVYKHHVVYIGLCFTYLILKIQWLSSNMKTLSSTVYDKWYYYSIPCENYYTDNINK